VRQSLKISVAAACAALCVATTAKAEDVAAFYRGKTMRIVIGFSSGGGYDQYGRLLSRHIGRHIPGQPTVVVQNMPGAASLKSVQYLDQGAPTDGTTIVTFNPGLITQSLTAPTKVPVDFRNFAWVGNISEDIRVCFTWGAKGIKNWKDYTSGKQIVYGNTGIGTSAYIEMRMLHEIFGVNLKQVQGYPGSADKRIAIEQGELDGDCGSWTSMPEDWLRDHKVDLITRFSKHLAPGLPEAVPYAGDLQPDPEKRATFELLMSGAVIGRPFLAPKSVPEERLEALRKAFDETMTDPEFLADAQKLNLLVTPMTGQEVATRIAEIYKASPAVVARAKAISSE
jgi:tripartite-type tricarboxylate transporter receptor subunit TctC